MYFRVGGPWGSKEERGGRRKGTWVKFLYLRSLHTDFGAHYTCDVFPPEGPVSLDLFVRTRGLLGYLLTGDGGGGGSGFCLSRNGILLRESGSLRMVSLSPCTREAEAGDARV